jgi:hypothetical protein
MDPNATLKELRRLYKECSESNYVETGLLEDLAENFNNLDEWLNKGGFLPKDWERK